MPQKIQAPRGTFDVLPEEARGRAALEDTARAILEPAGYGRIETPVFEVTELFARGVGESTDIVQKEMYTFEDGGGRSLTLRPEGTAPICRAYVEHGMHKRGGAHALGRDDLGSLQPGKKADVVLIKNDASPVSFPLLNPFGHVAFQAQRGDVHTVVVDGRVVKSDGKLVGIDLAPVRAEIENTIEYLRGACGEEVWQQGMFPQMPEAEAAILDNPYQYTDYVDEGKRAGGEDRVLGR